MCNYKSYKYIYSYTYGRFVREDMIVNEHTCHSIHHKSPVIVCSLKVNFLIDLTPKISFKDPVLQCLSHLR